MALQPPYPFGERGHLRHVYLVRGRVVHNETNVRVCLKARPGVADWGEVLGFEEVLQNVDDQGAGSHDVGGRDDAHEPPLFMDRPSAEATNPTVPPKAVTKSVTKLITGIPHTKIERDSDTDERHVTS